jgi:bifunctional enzyme CysN/CysC
MTQATAQKIDIAPAAEREQMKIVIVGHVDHGKSTLVGRLFHDTDSLPDGKLEEIQNLCKKRGMPFEYSFLMDALQAERDQGITIDTTQIWFKTDQRDYVIIDAPGHKEFLKNMISGAANSEAAVLVIDANEGVQEQSKRHGYLLHLLGVDQIAVAVNKMDMVDYSQEKFDAIEKEYRAYLAEIGVNPTHVIPISAREGDCIVEASKENMPWYTGPSVMGALDEFRLKPKDIELPLRFPVQDVYKFDERRIVVGRIESGSLSVGDELMFSPINKRVKVSSIENFNGPNFQSASAGMSVGITLSEQIFAERGNVISHTNNMPSLTNVFRAKIFWLGETPIEVGSRYTLKINTSEYRVEVKEIESVVDTSDLAITEKHTQVEKNAVAEIIFRVRGVAVLDPFADNAITGRFVVMDNYRICGGGIIDLDGFEDQRSGDEIVSQNITAVAAKVSPESRAVNNGHLGGVLWFSGLSGSGKSTLAMELERRLFAKGYSVYVLDGDNVRGGLNRDLGFSPEDRSENIRRIGEVAALFADSGTIVITSFISPYKKDRDQARIAAGDKYHSVHIQADVETCEGRDPKGLYKKARAGEIAEFTGVSAPFEEPDNADLVVDTANKTVDESVSELVAYVERLLVKPVKDLGKHHVGGGI